MTGPGRPSAQRGGFVLLVVVFLLFAVSVAAATGYLVVASEFAMARHASEGAKALTVARAGLERFVAEQIGAVGDSVSYALGDGVALVTTRRLFAQDPRTDVYYVRSEGTVADVRAPDTPARRVVGAYALHRRSPLGVHAALMVSAQQIRVEGGGSVRGMDQSPPGSCGFSGVDNIVGVVGYASITEESPTDIQGAPQTESWPVGITAFVDSVGVRWDVVSDPDFPVEFENAWPDFASLPADSFPVVRHSGWLATNQVGRGVLIVDGTFDPGPGFRWDGIVLAGHLDDDVQGEIHGVLVGGLDADNAYSPVSVGATVLYYSCVVRAANESLSYMELVRNTIFEAG